MSAIGRKKVMSKSIQKVKDGLGHSEGRRKQTGRPESSRVCKSDGDAVKCAKRYLEMKKTS